MYNTQHLYDMNDTLIGIRRQVIRLYVFYVYVFQIWFISYRFLHILTHSFIHSFIFLVMAKGDMRICIRFHNLLIISLKHKSQNKEKNSSDSDGQVQVNICVSLYTYMCAFCFKVYFLYGHVVYAKISIAHMFVMYILV